MRPNSLENTLVALVRESRKVMAHEFYVVIERDEDGFFVGEVPSLRGCYAQGKTLDELMQNMREVIELCLEEEPLEERLPEFIGVQKVEI
jgi:predicted RNase H-like HicB family nuclease